MDALLAKSAIKEATNRAAGRIRVGGRFWQVFHPTEQAFRDAAGLVIADTLERPDPSHLIQPAMHLFRHALELELKGLILAAWDVEEMSLSNEAVAIVRVRRTFKVKMEHKLNVLHKNLVKALKPLNALVKYGSPLKVSPKLTALVRDVVQAEKGDETRWRYSKGKHPAFASESFPDVQDVHLRALWERLVDYHATDGQVRLDAWKHADRTLSEELGEWGEGLEQGLIQSGVYQIVPDEEDKQ